jgi:hypothetical protein
MKFRTIEICFAVTAALTAQTVGAEQPVRPSDLEPLNAAINAETAARISADGGLRDAITAETAARTAADTQLQTSINHEAATRLMEDGALQAAINAETAARAAADAALEARIGGPTRLEGRYAFTGNQHCLASSTGFRTDIELAPLLVFPPPPPPTIPATVLTPSSTTVTGVRTFNGDGTGSSVATFHTITDPGTIVTGGFQSGGASISTLQSVFTYQVMPDMTVIIDDDPADGLITKGGTRVGWKTRSEGVPRFVGHISNDWKTIALHQEDLVVEQLILSSPASVTPPQQFITPRVCQRVRTMHKILN